ncbi:LysR family transcriptional regulator [Sphingobium chlorophenolicum]|uniref:LysR family transcriptional regulator n=2 Tax=Sphingobium chlorophenolicum TaxID=46429 RepID=A0A081RF14_SPHCR|nr:LysR family transcriptional regulator [Sphingobium chlorophenolicum]
MMEEELGVRLFERLPQGLRLTAAGEVLISQVRRWRRELKYAQAQIDDLRGLRRGEVTIAFVEGASDFLAETLVAFRRDYPGIDHNVRMTGAQGVVDLVLKGHAEVGLTFNPPTVQTVRLEASLIYQIGAVISPTHELAERSEVSFSECVELGLIVPNESISLRAVVDALWSRTIGGVSRGFITANSIALIKQLVEKGAGIGMMTPIDVAGEVASGALVHVPLSDAIVPLSVFSLITAGGRTLSVPASLLVQVMAQTMRDKHSPGVS